MIFIPLLILGIVLYFTDRRILSGVIFFFFISEGFQLIPLSWFDTGVIINKPSDFALFYILIIFTICLFKYRDFLIKDKMAFGILLFLSFIGICIGVSKFIYNVPWDEILRTCRQFFFVLGYFVFRRLKTDEIRQLLKILFFITTFLCTLYVIQSIIGYPLLRGASRIGTFGKINRYYNIPVLYFFFLFYAFFGNPLKNKYKIITTIIYVLVSIVSLHRSLIIGVFLLIFLGIFLQGGFRGIVRYIFIGGLILAPFFGKLSERFEEKTSKDMQSVMQGAFEEYGEEITVDGTFLFRIAFFYERYQYVIEEPVRIIFGVGFMTEDSPITEKKFDFAVGLPKEGTKGSVVQLETSDIAWANFILRIGFVGTAIFLYLYYIIAKKLYTHRKDSLMMASFLYILLLVVISVTSSPLYSTWMIILPMFTLILLNKNEENTLPEKNEKNA